MPRLWPTTWRFSIFNRSAEISASLNPAYGSTESCANCFLPLSIFEVSVEFRGFEKSENLLAVLADHLVKPDPMVARITYRYQPLSGLKEAPRSESDHEFIILGGDRSDNPVNYDLRRWMPLDLFPALRDAESDLARWSRSPLRPLLGGHRRRLIERR